MREAKREMTEKEGKTPSNEELWELLQEQRKRTDGLEAQLEHEREEKRSLATHVAQLCGSGERGARAVSRAGLLKAAVAGAAGLAGAGMLGWAEPEIAAANSGTCNAPYQRDRFVAFGACPVGVGFDATAGVFAIGVSGLGSETGVEGTCTGSGPGVLGTNFGGGTGVSGASSGGPNAIGVLGQGPNGVVGKTTLAGYAAVYGGAGANGVGVYGVTDGTSGVGVSGQGGAGRGGQFAGSQAQLSLVPSTADSPPTSNGQVGDLFLDANAGLSLCTYANVNALPQDAWKPLSAVVPITPVRVLDTRNGTGGVQGAQGTGTQLNFAPFDYLSQAVVPNQASGLVGTIRAYAPTGPGYLTVYPGWGSPPGTSNVNFYPNPSYPTTYAVANQVIVGIPDGQMAIYVGGPSGSSTHVVFDVSGYIQ